MRVEPPSAESERLRRLAKRYVDRRVPSGLDVALTGSAARGNAGRSSDVDLWVVGGRSTERRSRRFEGRAITELRSSLATALSTEQLALFEVDDLWVLRDDGGRIARIRARAAARRNEIRASIELATRGALDFELRDGRGKSPWHETIRLRQALVRLCAWHAYRMRGWRVPRISTSVALLPGRWRARVVAALAPGRPSRAQLARLAEDITAALPRSAWAGAPPALSRELDARLAHAPLDAAVLARWQIVEEWLPPVVAALELRDLGSCRAFSWGARLERCLGLAELDAARLRRLRALLQVLPGELGVLPRPRAQLARSARAR